MNMLATNGSPFGPHLSASSIFGYALVTLTILDFHMANYFATLLHFNFLVFVIEPVHII